MLIIWTNEGWKKPLQEESRQTEPRWVGNKQWWHSKIADSTEDTVAEPQGHPARHSHPQHLPVLGFVRFLCRRVHFVSTS